VYMRHVSNSTHQGKRIISPVNTGPRLDMIADTGCDPFGGSNDPPWPNAKVWGTLRVGCRRAWGADPEGAQPCSTSKMAVSVLRPRPHVPSPVTFRPPLSVLRSSP